VTWSVDEEMLQRCRDHVESGRVVVFDTETTVRLAKRLVPGQPSYSLASLIDALNLKRAVEAARRVRVGQFQPPIALPAT